MRSTWASFRRSNSNKSASEAAAINASSPRSQTSRDTGNLSRSSIEHRAVGRMRATHLGASVLCLSVVVGQMCSGRDARLRLAKQLACGNKRCPARYHCANRWARPCARSGHMRDGGLVGLAGCKVLCWRFSAKGAVGSVGVVAVLEGIDEWIEVLDTGWQVVDGVELVAP